MIGAQGARLLRDKRAGETLRVKRSNVAHRLPRGKRAPGVEINYFQTTENKQNIGISYTLF
ncbi:hypothetical protein QUF49_18635 [Fictibacillus sp. b24]|uniref:hypothetical protein n=1 Tax=Fictibacillus sp. b24 TaxID=3055863 RepID=UPI0025A0DB50|nr:hypothetical protein [Fictibacillus sp. b24]MDM5318018.1 hypothetical protein [Fictibacillus sp. b24]